MTPISRSSAASNSGIEHCEFVLGAYKDDDAGADSGSAYVFGPDGSGGWAEEAKLTASDAAAGDNFGWSVARRAREAAGYRLTTA